MDVWQNFFLAQVGASAALTGLIFVSVSISLKKILEHSKLVNRAFQVLAVLLQILVVSSLTLVPGQSLAVFGAEVLVVGIAVWIIATLFEFGSIAQRPLNTAMSRSSMRASARSRRYLTSSAAAFF